MDRRQERELPLGGEGLLGLVQDVAAAGNPLRVYVLPAAGYSCSTSTGLITPDIADAEVGAVEDAIVDGSAMISGDMASLSATVPVGDWTILVRGKGRVHEWLPLTKDVGEALVFGDRVACLPFR